MVKKGIGSLVSLAALVLIPMFYVLWYLETLSIMRGAEISSFAQMPYQSQHLFVLNDATWWDVYVLFLAVVLLLWHLKTLVTIANWKLSLGLGVAVLTFVTGVAIAAIWMTRETPHLEQLTVSRLRCFPGLGQKFGSLKPADNGYFPENASSHDELMTRFFNAYAQDLGKLNEPSFLNAHKNETSYRFLWVRSFHPTVVVRVSKEGEIQTLSVKELSRHDQLLVDHDRSLTKQEWDELMKLVDESCFWEFPTSTSDPLANDGAFWVLEGVNEKHYHVTTRQSPDSGSYRELCLYMLKLSGLPLAKNEIY